MVLSIYIYIREAASQGNFIIMPRVPHPGLVNLRFSRNLAWSRRCD